MNPGHEGTVERRPAEPPLGVDSWPASDPDAMPLRILLRFPDVRIERHFVEHYIAFYFRFAQASLVLGLVLIIGDYLVDHFAHPGARSNLLRLLVAVPLLIAALGYSVLPIARRHWQPLMAGFIVAVGISLFWILLRIDGEGGAGLKTWVGVLNFTFLEFYCFVILGVQFRYALQSGLLILCSFEYAMLAHASLSAADVAYWSYHVVTVFILAAGIGWWREFLLRKEFSVRASLAEAREAAEHLARLKGDFLATMSHEIRTPLNGVLGMNELLIGSHLTPQQLAWAEGVRASGRHLLDVINDVLDFSKVESGRMKLESVDFSVVDVVEEAVLMFAQPAQAKGLELAAQFDPPAVPLTLRGDPFRLRQVIANLISNAIKFTAAGEVVVRVSVTDQTENDVALHLCVEDTGIGVAPEALSIIFEHFSQGDGSTTRNYGGTGLGLAICRRLLELMGGTIRVESTPGSGAHFHVELRLAKSAATHPPASPPATLAGVSVLVVDDNRRVRDILKQQLEGWAMSVQCAADGAEALLRIKDSAREGRPFQLALLDQHLPGIDGRPLAAAIREQSSRPPLKLILLTTAYAGRDPDLSQTAGALENIDKPLRRADLLRAITRTLHSSPAGMVSPAPPKAGSVDALHGHVLLVEDNAINQLVATTMMHRFGLSVSLAADGAEAVERVRNQAFDLVLMDRHMPVMDGLEATRLIRIWEATRVPVVPALPIVALTATASAEDREACAAAGMTDYLSKPITSGSLFEALAKHLGVVNRAMATKTPDVAPSRALPAVPARVRHIGTRPVFDATVLVDLLRVDDLVDSDFALSVLEQFVHLSAQMMTRCEDAMAAADSEATVRQMHTLKSSGAQVGALALSACAAELEERLRAGPAPEEEDWSRLKEEHHRALEAIRAHLGRGRSRAAESPTGDCPA